MRLIAGLGNPGREHEKQRHNIGFMAVDEIARRHNFPPFQKKFSGLISLGRIGSDKVGLLKPTTFMNNSGQSVGAAMRFYELELDDVTIIHDELDLVPAKVRIKSGGGNGGHNGLRSLDAHIGKDYHRIRLGIGHPGNKAQVSRYVLSDFAKSDADWVDPLIDTIARDITLLLEDDIPGYMNALALAVKSDTAPETKPKKQPKQKATPNQKTPITTPAKKPSNEGSAEGSIAAQLKKLFGAKGE